MADKVVELILLRKDSSGTTVIKESQVNNTDVETIQELMDDLEL